MGEKRKKCRSKTNSGDPCKQWAVIDGLCLVHYQKDNKLKDDRHYTDRYHYRKARGEDVR